MWRFVQKSAVAVALIGLAGCSSLSSMAANLWPFGGGKETKAYACDDGSRMIVVFDDREEAASVSITGRPMQTLHRQSDDDGLQVARVLARISRTLVARWLDPRFREDDICLVRTFSPLANTARIGDGPKSPAKANLCAIARRQREKCGLASRARWAPGRPRARALARKKFTLDATARMLPR
jgi:hypothetical protein